MLKFRYIILIMLATIFFEVCLPTTPSLALEKATTPSYYSDVVFYGESGTLIPFTIQLYEWYKIIYTKSTSNSMLYYNISKHQVGGVIKDASTYAYPFSQEVKSVYAKWYKNSVYQNDIIFSVDNSSIVYDPKDKPFLYKNTSSMVLRSSDSNKFSDRFVWFSDETIPNTIHFSGKSITF
ncbi:MAG: hypothetical protein ACOY81_07960 [Bacillota bacterium]